MVKGKKPTAAQRKILQSYNRNPVDWLYVGQSVENHGESKRLSKNEDKTIRYKFIHRVTEQEIFLEE